MRNLFLTLFCLIALTTVVKAQDPGNPGRGDILTEKSQIVEDLKKENAEVKELTGVQSIPVKKSNSSAGKKIANSYIVLLKDEFVPPFIKQKSANSGSRESQIAAAKSHQAASEKAIRKYATEALGLSNDEIGEIFTGVQSGFTVNLKPKKAGAAAWMSQTKSAANTSDVFQDEEVEATFNNVESTTNAYSPAAWAPQYADYGNWVAGGCNCQGHSKWFWIVDTGIDLNHPDLNVNTGYGRSFVPGEPSAEDYNGHGTHVAGIAAAKNNSYGALGIAYNATVVPVKVLGASGGGSWSSVLSGLNWVYNYGIAGDVVNMSLSGGGNTSVDNCVKALAAKGIYVVMAAGNSSSNAGNYSPARTNGSKIYTIAATQYQPYWWLHNFASNYSNYGKPPVDFAAPGTSIYSTYKNGGYAYLTGTSMASPNFAGALMCGTKLKKGYYYYKVNPTSHNLYVIRAKN
ncbi:MAG: S8 family serine peptidase [Saprospiraceae bacterium]